MAPHYPPPRPGAPETRPGPVDGEGALGAAGALLRSTPAARRRQPASVPALRKLADWFHLNLYTCAHS
jgi:hypothetical protein